MLSCPDLKVHNEIMHNSNEAKYLRDQITSTANNLKTISKQKKTKGYGIISDIMYVIAAIPNGRHRNNVGLKLRLAWFLNKSS